MDPELTETVSELLVKSPGLPLCDRCLAYACATSQRTMRSAMRALFRSPAFRHALTCHGCRRTAFAIAYQVPVRKCAHCSRALEAGEPEIVLGGDLFHEGCVRRLMADDTIRVSPALNQQSRELIEQSRIRDGHASLPTDSS